LGLGGAGSSVSTNFSGSPRGLAAVGFSGSPLASSVGAAEAGRDDLGGVRWSPRPRNGLGGRSPVAVDLRGGGASASSSFPVRCAAALDLVRGGSLSMDVVVREPGEMGINDAPG